MIMQFLPYTPVFVAEIQRVLLPASDGKFHEIFLDWNLWNGVIANDLE